MEATNKAVRWFELCQTTEIPVSVNQTYIYVKSDYKLVQIELSKILYIEGLKDYIKIHTEDNLRPILSLVSMKTMEEKLPSGNLSESTGRLSYKNRKLRLLIKGALYSEKNTFQSPTVTGKKC